MLLIPIPTAAAFPFYATSGKEPYMLISPRISVEDKKDQQK